MRGIVFALGLAAMSAGQAFAQSAAEIARYTETIHEYQHGNPGAALRIVSEWPRGQVERLLRLTIAQAVSAARTDKSADAWRLAEAAAMLHTEIALVGVATADTKLVEHVSLAESVVRELPWRATAPFPQRWYALAASVFLWQTRPLMARPYVDL
jgi:hypothetical protein